MVDKTPEFVIDGNQSPIEHVANPIATNNPSPVFDVRLAGWENISVPVPNDVEQALIAANLNWKVLPRPVMVDGEIVKRRIANVRSDLPPGENVLEIVGSKYKIVQNIEAYAFLQNILDTGTLKLERGGTFNNGRSVFLLASTQGMKVGGETIAPYIVFINSHDGTSTVKVALTTLRIICANMLTLILNSAPRKFEVMHTKSAMDRMKAAQASMNFIGNYLTAYPMLVERMIDTPISENGIALITDTLFPIPTKTETNSRAVENAKDAHDMFARVYNDTPDLKPFSGTAWGIYNAYADYISHVPPKRITHAFEENRFARNVNGLNLERAQQTILNAAMVA